MHPDQPFYEHMRAFLRRNTPLVRTIAVPARRRIYTIGDDDRRIYFVESGGVKLGVGSNHGRDFFLDIMVAGDLFGETCLTGSHERLESATTVSRTVLKAITYEDFFPFLRHHTLYEPFLVELAARIGELENMVADLATLPSERRLAKTLLRLAAKAPAGGSEVRLPYRLSQEELAEFVGTTRPRISSFMNRFRKEGLIDWTTDRFVLVRVDRLTEFLASQP
ncbi:MAG: transcriptional regulator, Crp/Fnr family [Acidobacteria bacterium]|jgi:CRP-like cAMP-binding protein|nr:transcriptional regulator, Crp/Fnr family [Acidobacteriota bacterium]